MSKRTWVLAAALGLLTGLAPQGARGQGYIPPPTSPFPRPPISPYLNLYRGGSPAINYYGVIRPQQQLYQGLYQVQQQAVLNQAALAAGDASLPITGHPTRFFNYSHYFMNQGGLGYAGGYAGGGVGTGAGAPLFGGFNPLAGGGAGLTPQRPSTGASPPRTR